MVRKQQKLLPTLQQVLDVLEHGSELGRHGDDRVTQGGARGSDAAAHACTAETTHLGGCRLAPQIHKDHALVLARLARIYTSGRAHP